MRFNSKSVTLNRGLRLNKKVEIPSEIYSYEISDDVWNTAIADFNTELDARTQVSEIIDGIKVDVLRINRNVGDVILWIMVDEKDMEFIKRIKFTLSGTVLLAGETSNVIEKLIMKDLIFGSSDNVRRSIFKKRTGLRLS
jgi:hypothetical protein